MPHILCPWGATYLLNKSAYVLTPSLLSLDSEPEPFWGCGEFLGNGRCFLSYLLHSASYDLLWLLLKSL